MLHANQSRVLYRFGASVSFRSYQWEIHLAVSCRPVRSGRIIVSCILALGHADDGSFLRTPRGRRLILSLLSKFRRILAFIGMFIQ